MRRVRYSVACSLDGFIAGPNGEHDWIIMDPSIDFAAFFASIDTVLLGRRTFEVARRQGSGGGMPGMEAIVCSRTLRPADYPGVTIRDDAVATVTDLKARAGKDIWLMGGGDLFRSLLAAHLIDAIEVAIVPVLLGAGISLLPGPFAQFNLQLTSSKALESGVLLLTYEPASAAPKKRRAKTASKRSG
ncbi:MAG: dihydrofolate reductase family protein [Planctomycetota bacterium]